jgi:hypothetical protein
MAAIHFEGLPEGRPKGKGGSLRGKPSIRTLWRVAIQ